MSSGLIIVPNYMPALDTNGRPIPGALMWFYLNRTTTLTTVYSDVSLSVPLSNPVVADSSGVFPAIFGNTSLLYTVAVTTADGSPLAAYDDVSTTNRESPLFNVAYFGAVGGDYTKDNAAFNAAYNAAAITGGNVYVPPLAGGPLTIDAKVFTDLGGGRNNVFVTGDGESSTIAPHSSTAYLFDFQGGNCGLSGIYIIDSNNYITTAAWRTKFANPPYGDRLVTRCNFTSVRFDQANGSAWMWENDGMGGCVYYDMTMQNNYGFLNNNSGGTNIIGSVVRSLGTVAAARFSNAAPVGHAEGAYHANWRMACTRSTSAIGCLYIHAGLALTFEDVQVVQLGYNSTSLDIDGDTGEGLNYLIFNTCYFEGAGGGAQGSGLVGSGFAIRIRGATYAAGIVFTNCGNGQGGYDAGQVRGIAIANVNGVTFQNHQAFFPITPCYQQFTSLTSTYRIIDCFNFDRTVTANTSVTSFGSWVRSSGVPPVRSATDNYPQAAWSQITGLVVASSGGSLGAGATATLDYTRDGMNVTGTLTVFVPLKGTGTGNLRVTLPPALVGVNTRDQPAGLVREFGVTNGFGYGAYIATGTIIITTTAGAFPCAADGYNFEMQMTWEAGS